MSNKLHVTATTLATYFSRLQCDRYLLFETSRDRSINNTNKNNNSLIEAQFEKGILWEEKICLEISPILRCPFNDNKKAYDWSIQILLGNNKELINLLENNNFVYIHGSVFYVPESFYSLHNINIEHIYLSLFKPDFLILRLLSQDDNNKKLIEIQIIDAKASSHLKISHQIQVSYYSHVLESITSIYFKDLPTDYDYSISNIGGIWMPDDIINGSRIVGNITYFNISVFYPILEKVYKTLEKLYNKDRLNPNDTTWFYSPKCSYCEYKSICEKNTINLKRIGYIPDINTSTQLWITSLIHNHSTNITNTNDIEDLYKLIQPNNPLHINSKLLYPSELCKLYNILNFQNNGSSSVIKSITNKSIQLKQVSSLQMSFYPSDIQIFLYIILNPLTEQPFCLSILITDNTYKSLLELQTCSLDILSFKEEFINKLEYLCNILQEEYSNKTISFFIRSKQEKQIFIDFLISIILSNTNLAIKAEYIFITLIDDVNCLYCSEQPDLFKNNNNSILLSPRIIIIHNVIQELFAIPQAGYTTYENSYKYISKSPIHIISDDIIFKNTLDNKIENVYNNLKQNLKAICDCIKQIRYKLLEFCSLTGEFPTNYMIPKHYSYPSIITLKDLHPILRMIVFICQYEIILERDEYIEKRIKGPKGCIIPELQVNEWTKDKKECTVIKGLEQLTECGDKIFYNWIAIEEKNLYKLYNYNDFNTMDIFYKYKKFTNELNLTRISLLDINTITLNNNKPSTVLITNKGYYWEKDSHILLLPRLINFNIKKIIKQVSIITQLLQDNKTSEFINLISNPIKWSKTSDLYPSCDIILEKEQILKKVYFDAANLSFNNGTYSTDIYKLRFQSSQRKAFLKLASSRLTLVQGPPGTGKTHFLALTMMRMIEISSRIKTPLKILATAYTNTAIDKLIEKTQELLELEKQVYYDNEIRLKWTKNIRITRTLSSISTKVKYIEDGYDIIGSTCWQINNKIAKKIKFDIILVDEGSQLPVNTALLFMELLKPQGRLVIAGDHQQLGPVLHGQYPNPSNNNFSVQGSLFDSLLWTKDGNIISYDKIPFININDLENLIMLHENNRMNADLNAFTQRIYNQSYISINPKKSLYLIKEDKIPKDLSYINKNILYPTLYSKASMSTIQLELDNNIHILSHEHQLLYERLFIEHLIDGFLLFCKEKPSIFIVVPHRSQRTSLQTLIVHEKYKNIKIKAETVDRIQGQEADIVIISYIYFDKEQIALENEFLYNRRRLNVSMSRAEKFCLFLGTKTIIEPPVEVLGSPKCTEAYQHILQFINICKKIQTYYSIQTSNIKELE